MVLKGQSAGLGVDAHREPLQEPVTISSHGARDQDRFARRLVCRHYDSTRADQGRDDRLQGLPQHFHVNGKTNELY